MTDPVNTPIEDIELLARNIYHSSQYSHGELKKDCMFPNFRRESRELPGRHRCHVSIQRLCYGRWDGIKESAEATKGERQTLMGFMVGRASQVREKGFELQPAAHERNPYHAHIYIPELDIPYSPDAADAKKVFNAEVLERLMALTDSFTYHNLEAPLRDFCNGCFSPK